MATKKCDTCGQTKTEEEFSKSYRNRCKECVARFMRESRAAAKAAEESNTLIIPELPGTILDDKPNWEERRYTIALDVFYHSLFTEHISPREAAATARRAADAFIDELKRNSPQD